MTTPETNTLYSWNYNDNKNRSPLWYMIALAIAIGLIIWWFFTRQYGMSIVIMLAVGFFYFLENNTADDVEIRITDLWIMVQESFYDFSRISAFNIIFSWENAIFLRLSIAKRWVSTINLRVDNTVVSDIKPLLANYIEENPKQELTFIERVSHSLKL